MAVLQEYQFLFWESIRVDFFLTRKDLTDTDRFGMLFFGSSSIEQMIGDGGLFEKNPVNSDSTQSYAKHTQKRSLESQSFTVSQDPGSSAFAYRQSKSRTNRDGRHIPPYAYQMVVNSTPDSSIHSRIDSPRELEWELPRW